MTAARSDAVHPAPVAPTGEWPVAPRFSVVPVAAPIAVVEAPEPEAAVVSPEAVVVTPEPEAVIEMPEPVAEIEVAAPAPAPALEMPEPVAEIEVAAPVPAPALEMPEPVATIEVGVPIPVPTPEAHVAIEAVAVAAPAPPVAPVVPEAAVLPAEAAAPVMPAVPAVPPVPDVQMPAPYAPIVVSTPAPIPAADAVTPVLLSPLPTGAPVAPHLASPLQPVPDAPAMPAAPQMPAPPVMPGAPVMPAAPAVDPNAPIQLPVFEHPDGMSVAEWPIDRVADLRPDGAAPGGRLASLPSLPEIPGVSRQFLLVAALAGLAGVVAIRGLGGGEEPVAPPTPAAQTAVASWQATLPKVLPVGDVDALTLDERELRPARVKHQLELAVAAMKPGEVIRELTVRTDGTMMLAVMHGTQERAIVTKGVAPAAPETTQAAGTPILAIDPIEIDARVPRKLLRAVEKANGVAPTTMELVRSAAIRGGQPTWVMRWTPTGKPATTVYASQDGRQLASTADALK